MEFAYGHEYTSTNKGRLYHRFDRHCMEWAALIMGEIYLHSGYLTVECRVKRAARRCDADGSQVTKSEEDHSAGGVVERLIGATEWLARFLSIRLAMVISSPG